MKTSFKRSIALYIDDENKKRALECYFCGKQRSVEQKVTAKSINENICKSRIIRSCFFNIKQTETKNKHKSAENVLFLTILKNLIYVLLAYKVNFYKFL